MFPWYSVAYHANEWVLPRVEGFGETFRGFGSDTTSAGHDFVEDKERSILVAYSSYGFEVAR